VIKIHYWRITKYNPKNRDENGIYQKYEWTSVSEVGKIFDNGELLFDVYLFCENAYIDAIIKIMRENGVESLKVDALEIHNYDNYADFTEPTTKKYFRTLRNNMLIPKQEVAQVSRFILRELIWCKLVSDRMFVHFGYDYYMYIGSEQQSEELLKAIESNGLFVEIVVSPYL